jgi:hypothetical protein
VLHYDVALFIDFLSWQSAVMVKNAVLKFAVHIANVLQARVLKTDERVEVTDKYLSPPSWPEVVRLGGVWL